MFILNDIHTAYQDNFKAMGQAAYRRRALTSRGPRRGKAACYTTGTLGVSSVQNWGFSSGDRRSGLGPGEGRGKAGGGAGRAVGRSGADKARRQLQFRAR